jgi:hypothetical protein
MKTMNSIHKKNPLRRSRTMTGSAKKRTGTKKYRSGHTHARKTRRRVAGSRMLTMPNMRGGNVDSKGVLELTSDSAIYIISNIVRLFSNMAAASVGYKPIEDNLAVPGTSVDGSLMKKFKEALEYAKVPIGIVTGVVAQYVNVLNLGMRVNAPILQASLAVTIKIIKAQLSLANATLQNKSFVTALKSTLESLELVSDEIVTIVDPVATDILNKLSPIINNGIGKVFQTISTSALSGAQSIPYAGTVLAALSSLDSITKMAVASVNAGTATASLFMDGYTNTVEGVSGAISRATGRINNSAANFQNPAAAASSAAAAKAKSVTQIQKGGSVRHRPRETMREPEDDNVPSNIPAFVDLGYADMSNSEFNFRKSILMRFLSGSRLHRDLAEYTGEDIRLIGELPDDIRGFLADPRITSIVEESTDSRTINYALLVLNALRNVVLIWISKKLPRMPTIDRAEFMVAVTAPMKRHIESLYLATIGYEDNILGRRFVIISRTRPQQSVASDESISVRIGGAPTKKQPLRIAAFNDIRDSIVPRHTRKLHHMNHTP